MKTSSKKALPRKDLGVKNVDDGLLILDKNSEKIHQLNETAALVWACLADGQETAEIAVEIAKNFDVSPTDAKRDIAKIIGQFEALGLLQTETSE